MNTGSERLRADLIGSHPGRGTSRLHSPILKDFRNSMLQLSAACGLALICFGALVAGGWLLRIRGIVRISNTTMTLDSALCFIGAGTAIYYLQRKRFIARVIAAMLLPLACVYLFVSLGGHSLSLHSLFPDVTKTLIAPAPVGRLHTRGMAGLVLLLTCSLCLLTRQPLRPKTVFVTASLLTLASAGGLLGVIAACSGLAGDAVWAHSLLRMSLGTAACGSVGALGLTAAMLSQADGEIRAKIPFLITGIGGITLILVLAVVQSTTLTFSRRVTESRQNVVATSDRMERLNALVSAIRRVESAQRGFLLTEDEAYWRDYVTAAGLASSASNGLPADYSRLKTLVSEKLSELEETVQLQHTGKRLQALSMVRSGRGRSTMAAIEAQLEEHLKQLRLALAGQMDVDQRSFAAMRTTIVTAYAMALLLIFGGLLLIHREMKSGSRLTFALQKSAEELERRVALRTAELSGKTRLLQAEVEARALAELQIRQSERLLRERNDQLARIFDSGIVGDWTLNIGRDEVCAHAGVWRLWGADTPLISSPASWFHDRYHPADADRITREFNIAIEQHLPLEIEFRILFPDGSIRWIARVGSVMYDDRGEAVQVQGLDINITERKKVEEAAKASEQQILAMTESVPQMLWFAANDGSIKLHNQRWYEYTGVGAEETLGWTWQPVIHPEDLDTCLASWNESLRTGQVYEVKTRLRRADGAYRWHLGRAIPYRNGCQEIALWFGSWTDIENEIQAQERLEEEVRLRTVHLTQLLRHQKTLLNEVHHRVKNNLQVISSLLRMQSETVVDPTAVSALKESQRRVLSMAMIHERLYGSKQMDRIDFADYTEMLASELFASFGSRSSHITLRIEAVHIHLAVDQAVPCGLILNELLTNALKYAYPADESGEVVVTLTEDPAGAVTITVADQGRGLPPGFDWSTSKSLGLPIVDILAAQIGGSLTLGSGPGTTFIVAFPKEDPVRQSATAA